MKVLASSLFVAAGLISGSVAVASVYDLSVDYLFVPQNFDDNDNVQIVLDGWLNSNCDQALKPKVTIHADQGIIEVQAQARHGEGLCLPLLTPYTVVVDLGILPHGQYHVVTNNGWLVESMIVAESDNAGPDDVLYAAVEAAEVDFAPDPDLEMDSRWSVLLRGHFTNSCQKWEEIKVIDSGRVFEVLPIVVEEGEVCSPVMVPFEARAFLPEIVEEGRYLLHVRSRDGEALNVVFSAPPLEAR